MSSDLKNQFDYIEAKMKGTCRVRMNVNGMITITARGESVSLYPEELTNVYEILDILNNNGVL